MWPFGSSYPEHTAEDVDGKTYDYVIVGGKSRQGSRSGQESSC